MQFTSWNDLWRYEARVLCRILPRFLLGGAPLTILCFQPINGGRFIYLQDKDEPHKPITYPPGLNAGILAL